MTCAVCGAMNTEVGPEAGAFSVCALSLGTEDEPDDVQPWERANCLHEQLEDADARAWVEAMHRKAEAGEIPRTEPPPGLVAAMEGIRKALHEEPPAA